MRTPTPRSRAADDGLAVVTAPTLQEAYRRVQREHGADARIVGSRTLQRREARGLGRERLVEVTVQTGPGRPGPADAAASGAGGLAEEVARVERLVDDIESLVARRAARDTGSPVGPLGSVLAAAGAAPETVAHLQTSFAAETGRPRDDRPGFLAWLTDNIPAANSDWDGFYGCHAFLGLGHCGRGDLVLATARALQARGRRTLVLSILPAHRGEVRRLQAAAADGGFDAAIIQKQESIAAAAEHLGDYDAALLDLPDLDASAAAPGGGIHRWLAPNEGFHRHLVLPLDGDPRDLADLAPRAREWNADWLALTHTGRTRRWGKILDLQRTFGLALSLLAGAAADDAPRIAAAGALLDRMLDTEPDPGAAGAGFVAAPPVTAEA